jgi:hypothetical protein
VSILYLLAALVAGLASFLWIAGKGWHFPAFVSLLFMQAAIYVEVV